MSDTTAQDAIDRTRARLLHGRGPGAGEREVARHTRDRTEIGGVAVPELLEATAAQAAATRGDPAALAHRVVRQRARLASDLCTVVARAQDAVRPTTGRAVALVVGVVVGALVGWLLRSRRGWRSTDGPPASRPARAPRAPRRRRTRST
jgi:hypothetical protein